MENIPTEKLETSNAYTEAFHKWARLAAAISESSSPGPTKCR
jgi:hypothetical protein